MKINNKFNKDKLFFTSDPHYFHDNIIKYCSRPFKDVNDMEEQLINNWNNIVDEDSDIFLLGDFSYKGGIEHIERLLTLLNGRIWLVLGNHDYQNKIHRDSIKDLFEGRVFDSAFIKVEDEEISTEFEYGYMKIYMTHFPHLYWERNSVHLHGHIHSGPLSTGNEVVDFHPMRYDVGVDNNNYTPISYEEMKVIITKQGLRGR